MLEDHQALGKQINDFASLNDITLSADTILDMSAMNSENEATFDTAWTNMMIAGHQQMTKNLSLQSM